MASGCRDDLGVSTSPHLRNSRTPHYVRVAESRGQNEPERPQENDRTRLNLTQGSDLPCGGSGPFLFFTEVVMDTAAVPTDVREWLPLSEASHQLGMSRERTMRRIFDHTLRGERFFGRWFVHRSSIEAARASGAEPE